MIEVTGDGKTAKGVWIAIGCVARTDAQTGEVQCFGRWDKYGVDLIKEDGVWKFWHFHIYRIFRCAQRMKKSQTSALTRQTTGNCHMCELMCQKSQCSQVSIITTNL